jgi:phosphatidylglycerophosphate synthase
MIDKELNRYTNSHLNRIANTLYERGVAPNWATLLGLALAFLCFVALSYGLFYLGLILILINRFLDGLDGSLARLGTPRKFGAFFDITSDFAFYALIPLGFAVFSPHENALPTAFLLAAFYVNGSSFLAEAIIIEKYNIKIDQADKGFVYSFGLIEGFETICFFLFICLFPNVYANAAYIFFTLTLLTHVIRVFKSFKRFL